eukprot:SAG22_NODE_13161_length_416_cov_1.520505_1_plen_128_part_01
MNSFVSGGFLPAVVQGTKYTGLVAAWDWYATFCSFAGVDATDHRAAVAGLPPIDSIDMTPVLLGKPGNPRPRTALPLGSSARQLNISAPLCSSYRPTQTYDAEHSGEVDDITGLTGNCSTVVGIIIEQ